MWLCRRASQRARGQGGARGGALFRGRRVAGGRARAAALVRVAIWEAHTTVNDTEVSDWSKAVRTLA